MNPPDYIKVLPNGQWVLVHDSHLSRWSEQHGTIVSDPNVHKFLRPYLTAPGVDVVWDLGANIGDHTRAYLDLGKTVVAFEPNPAALVCLGHNCPEATCLRVAASDKEEMKGFQPLENVGASRIVEVGAFEVQCVRLDDMTLLPPPDFIKIDIEGWEMHALEGMKETLRAKKPAVFIEINRGALADNGFTPEHTTDFMENLGYSRMLLYPEKADWSWPQFDALFLP